MVVKFIDTNSCADCPVRGFTETAQKIECLKCQIEALEEKRSGRAWRKRDLKALEAFREGLDQLERMRRAK